MFLVLIGFDSCVAQYNRAALFTQGVDTVV